MFRYSRNEQKGELFMKQSKLYGKKHSVLWQTFDLEALFGILVPFLERNRNFYHEKLIQPIWQLDTAFLIINLTFLLCIAHLNDPCPWHWITKCF